MKLYLLLPCVRASFLWKQAQLSHHVTLTRASCLWLPLTFPQDTIPPVCDLGRPTLPHTLPSQGPICVLSTLPLKSRSVE